MRFQFSVRQLFVAVTLACVVSFGMRNWWAPRLEDLVEKHNSLLDARRFDELERNAALAMRHYPDSAVSTQMHRESAMIGALLRGEKPPFQFFEMRCGLGQEPADDDSP